MSKKVGTIFMILGALLIIGAVSLLVYNRIEDKESGAAADAVLQQLQAAISEGEQKTTEPDNEASSSPQEPTEPSLSPDIPQVEIDGQEYMGYLVIPALDLQLPVISNWSDAGLKIAPCRHTGSIAEDNLVIAGHNYSKHFGQLDGLKAGDLVLFTDLAGQTYIYEVIETERLAGTAIEAMLQSGYDLTLYTCTYGGQDRIAVRCNRK